MRKLQLGYFEGRHIAAETAISLLIEFLSEEQKLKLKGMLEEIHHTMHSTLGESKEFLRGFDECMKRLEFMREVENK